MPMILREFDNSLNGEQANSPAMLRPIIKTGTSFFEGEADAVSMQFIAPVTKWAMSALQFAEHGFDMTGIAKNSLGLSAFMSKLVEGYPDPQQRDEDWRLQVVEHLQGPTN
jgi:hypothetical protein